MKLRGGILFFFMSFFITAHAAKLDSINVNNAGNIIVIQCTTTNAMKSHVFTLSTPNRLVIDLGQTTTTLPIQKTTIGHGIIKRLRHGYPNPQTLRLVFEVKQPVSVSIRGWQKINAKSSRLVLHINKKTSGISHHVTQITHAMHRASARGLRDVIVVIDPGHGGKDPGAMGPNRHTEKSIVLAIAQRLKRLIDRQPGMHAVLTRNGDYYVGLRQRLAIARRNNADIFVAIHADAFINRHSNGASVFALSQRGATSEAARWLAEKENNSELGGVKRLDDYNGLIRTVLIDLSQTATISASIQLGKQVLYGLGKMTRLHNQKVEQARFVVLKSPDIPSILVETGFISNPQEERNLTSQVYQSRLTYALFYGIKQYFTDYPPHGTRLETASNTASRTSWL